MTLLDRTQNLESKFVEYAPNPLGTEAPIPNPTAEISNYIRGPGAQIGQNAPAGRGTRRGGGRGDVLNRALRDVTDQDELQRLRDIYARGDSENSPYRSTADIVGLYDRLLVQREAKILEDVNAVANRVALEAYNRRQLMNLPLNVFFERWATTLLDVIHDVANYLFEKSQRVEIATSFGLSDLAPESAARAAMAGLRTAQARMRERLPLTSRIERMEGGRLGGGSRTGAPGCTGGHCSGGLGGPSGTLADQFGEESNLGRYGGLWDILSRGDRLMFTGLSLLVVALIAAVVYALE